jgi:uncharacterized protein
MSRIRCARITLGFFALIAAPVPAVAQGRGGEQPPFINAVGRSTIRAIPDRATVLVVVQTNAATAAEAAASLARVERAVLDTLMKAGLPRGGVTSTSYGIGPSRTPQGMPADRESLYSGRSVITLRITPLDRITSITAAALARGAALIGQPRFELGAADSVRAIAFQQAVADAQRQAAILAAGSNGRLGRLREIWAEEPVIYDQMQQGYLPIDSPYDSQMKPSPEVTITVTVRGRWELVITPTPPPGA